MPGSHLQECGRRYTDDQSRWQASANTSKLCSGLWLLQPGNASLAFLDAWAARLLAKRAGAKNQPHFNAAIEETPGFASDVPQRGQSGRLGGVAAGHHGLLCLDRKA